MRRRTRLAGASKRGGFTLLELVVAVTMLATFILPMLWIIAECQTRATRSSIEREARGLAQAKLHDRMHYYEVEDAGTFADDGRSSWEWQIAPPEMRAQGEQIILTYTITVHIPQNIRSEESPADSGATESERGGTDLTYTMWTFPDARWYEEQDLLFERGLYSPLYGDPATGLGGAGTGGLGATGAMGGVR